MTRSRTLSCVMHPIELTSPARPSDLFSTPDRKPTPVCPPAPKKKRTDPLFFHPLRCEYQLDSPSFLHHFFVVKQCTVCHFELVTHMDDPDCDECGGSLESIPKVNFEALLPVFE